MGNSSIVATVGPVMRMYLGPGEVMKHETSCGGMGVARQTGRRTGDRNSVISIAAPSSSKVRLTMIDWLVLLVAFLAALLRIIVIPCKARETHEEI